MGGGAATGEARAFEQELVTRPPSETRSPCILVRYMHTCALHDKSWCAAGGLVRSRWAREGGERVRYRRTRRAPSVGCADAGVCNELRACVWVRLRAHSCRQTSCSSSEALPREEESASTSRGASLTCSP